MLKSPCMACPLKDADKSSEQCMKCDERVAYVRAVAGDEHSAPESLPTYGRKRMDTVKSCPKCDKDKPFDEFYRNKSTKDGLSYWCKSCQREADQEYKKQKAFAKNAAKLRTAKKINKDSPVSLNTVKQPDRRRLKSIYYDAGGIETIDVIRAKLTKDQFIGFLMGNVIKYSSRINHKGDPARDAEKCAEYAGWLSEELGK